MAKRVRLIALDLDGTLLTRAGTVSEGNAAAVREAVAAGVHIVFATSRWYVLAKRTADLLGVSSPIICHNGAMIRTPADGAALLHLTLPAAAAIDIAAVADSAQYDGLMTVGDATYLRTRRQNIDPARLPFGVTTTQQLSPHAVAGADAFLFFGKDAVEGIPRALDSRHAGELNLATGYSATFPAYLNIVHAGADKGRALTLVCEHLGVPLAEAMAIGDAAPDLEMMRVAGISMAMGNAPPEVKSQVDVIGPGNEDDGVAWAIREYAL